MRIRNILTMVLIALSIANSPYALAGIATAAARDTAEFIIKKFGAGAAGATVDEVSAATAKVIARHGDAVVPFLRSSGHAGLKALEAAGDNAPAVLKLYARRGDEALWVISDPKRLAIYLKHGDSAADALLKHPGLSDNLIQRFGDNAVTALNGISKQSAQRLGIAADEGLLSATSRSTELLPVIRQYGDQAMEFIWKHKGALTVAAVLGSFLADPQVYISGAKDLLNPISANTNWTLIIAGILVIAFLPFIMRSLLRARRVVTSDSNKAS
jgi:hypothetical protein